MKQDKLQERMSNDMVQEKVRHLKKLFPEAFTESGLNFDTLRQLLGDLKILDRSEERYELNWHGKNNARKMALMPPQGTLLACPTESVEWNTTQNLFIEGDNLEVLKLLQKSYANRIKVIYIDPPYNTGKDFVYSDKFQDNLNTYLKYTGQASDKGLSTVSNTQRSGRRHTNWLNMMYPRLKLARSLLSSNGIIFISIDDNEQANLKKLCDELFGEENALVTMIWSKGNAQNDAQGIQKNHEYVLAYVKDSQHLKEKNFLKVSVNKKIKLLQDERGHFYLGSSFTTGAAGGTLNNRPNLGCSVYYNGKQIIAVNDYDKEKARTSNDETEVYETCKALTKKGYVPIRPPKKDDKLGRWTWSMDKFNASKHLVYVVEKDGSFSLKKKEYIEDLSDCENIIKVEPPRSVLTNINSTQGSKVVNKLLGHNIFDNPKPVELIQHLLRMTARKSDIVLDFFAGSGTTAHAVMQLNLEDEGRRCHISVQLPEAANPKSDAYKAGYTTVAKISKERIIRAAQEIKEKNPGYRGDLGFKAFRLEPLRCKKST